MSYGHLLAKLVYCNETLTCATAIERTLFNCSASTISAPPVHFEKGLCSVCGIEKLSKQRRVQQGCKGDASGKWTKRLPICVSYEAKGLLPGLVSKTKAAAASAVRAGKRKAVSMTGGCVENNRACCSDVESVSTVSGTDGEPSDQDYEGVPDARGRREELCRRSACRMGGNGWHVDRPVYITQTYVLLMSHASIQCATMLVQVSLRRADVSACRRMHSAGLSG